jgi:protein SCO1/2
MLAAAAARTFYVSVCVVALSSMTDTALANAVPGFNQEQALGHSRAALGRTLGLYPLVDRYGEPFSLAALRGKPLVISLIYTSCHHTCPLVTQHLAQVVRSARDALGARSFSVVTIGFDSPVDTPERMRQYARERGIDDPDWYFLSADQATTKNIVNDLGFWYTQAPQGYDHTVQATIVDPEGKVYQQIYGEVFSVTVLVEPLKALLLGDPRVRTLSGLLDGVRLLCTIYDPNAGRYRFDYSIAVAAVIGFLCLVTVVGFIVHAWRGNRKASAPNSTASSAS